MLITCCHIKHNIQVWRLGHGASMGEAFFILPVLSCSAMSDSLWSQGLLPISLLCPWNSPDKNTGMGCQSFIQGIFPTQGSNPGLWHCRQILYRLSHKQSLLFCLSYLIVAVVITWIDKTSVILPCLYLLDLWLHPQAQSFTLGNENSCVLFNQIWYNL